MEIRQNLELVSVEYESNGKKAVMTFLDKERGEVRVVNFNKQVYRDGNYVDDADKAAKVEEWCRQFFGTDFDGLKDKIGAKKDVYVYERFNSLFEVEQIEKFTSDMVGQIYQTAISDITVDTNAIRVRYEIDGKVYESKMSYATYFQETGQWFVDPQKKDKQMKKFEDKFGVPVSEKDSLIGHALMVEVKLAMGKFPYGDMKKFPPKKKK